MASKYGVLEYADVVVGFEVVNEPISWRSTQFSATEAGAQDAYAAVKEREFRYRDARCFHGRPLPYQSRREPCKRQKEDIRNRPSSIAIVCPLRQRLESGPAHC
jgi:hypothetical protein